MRLSKLAFLAFTVALGVLSNMPADAQGMSAAVVSSANEAQDQPKLDINIDINDGGAGGGQWYANPVWMAIGGLGLVVLIALIVMAGRGGGTTVVKG